MNPGQIFPHCVSDNIPVLLHMKNVTMSMKPFACLYREAWSLCSYDDHKRRMDCTRNQCNRVNLVFRLAS